MARCVPKRRAVTLLTGILTVPVLLLSATPAEAVPSTPEFRKRIDKYAKYDGQDTCSPVPKPGVVAFRSMIMSAYPGTGDYGIIRGCSVGGISEHKEGRAWDWRVSAYNARQSGQARELLAWLLEADERGREHARLRRLGIMYVIWNRQIWSTSTKEWRPYYGASAHTDHVHFSFGWDGALKQTTWWKRKGPKPDGD